MAWSAVCKHFRRIIDRFVRPSTASSARAPLQLPHAPAEKTRLRRIGDLPALEETTEQDARSLELVHVLEDEDLHLARPQRHVGGVRMTGDRGRIAARER